MKNSARSEIITHQRFLQQMHFSRKKILLDWRRVVVDQIISWAAVFFAITTKRFFGGLEGRKLLEI